jgi:RNA 2',3'-cyclic 3'-phosphodiesterase
MSRDPRVRLFAALDPPPEVCEGLADWARAAAAGLCPGGRERGARSGALRLLDPAQMHVTVCFLGSRPVDEVDALAATIPACAAHACELELGAPVWLPPRRPQALAVEIHDEDGELSRLHEQLERALAAAAVDWEPQRRRFRAHVTVARVRGGGRRERNGRAAHPAPPPTPQVRFAPESLTLYRSWLDPGGAKYEPLARCSLLPAGA